MRKLNFDLLFAEIKRVHLLHAPGCDKVVLGDVMESKGR